MTGYNINTFNFCFTKLIYLLANKYDLTRFSRAIPSSAWAKSVKGKSM